MPAQATAGAPSPEEDGDTAVEETVAAPVDVTGGAGLEQTLEGHDRTIGDVLYTGPDIEEEEKSE